MSESKCPECDEPVDEEGLTRGECSWGPEQCDECFGCYCDGSC